MDSRIIPYLPDDVDLYFVDYDQDLDDCPDKLQACISENSINPIGECIFDWWDYPEGPYLDDIKEKMEDDDLVDLFEENKDEIEEWLREKDTSTPVDDLFRNTRETTMFYSLGVEFGGYSAGDCGMQQYNIRRKFGIAKGSSDDKKIHDIINESYNGGELRIYFHGDIRNFITEQSEEFKQITFNGQYVIALYNSGEGSGFFEEFEINKSFPFQRDNLFVSDSEKYDLEDCFGLCYDWLNKCAHPTLSYEPMPKKTKIAKSNASKLISKDAEYSRIYKSGKCSYGDMDYSRHRGVTYSNNYPCGSKCPHCGTFWVD